MVNNHPESDPDEFPEKWYSGEIFFDFYLNIEDEISEIYSGIQR